MTSAEMLHLAGRLDLCGKEMAHLLGISERTILRGVQEGGIIDIFLHDLQEGLDDPSQTLHVRAAAVMAAQSGGLRTYLRGLRLAYVRLDALMHQDPELLGQLSDENLASVLKDP